MNAAGAPGDPVARKRALRSEARRAGAKLAAAERLLRSRQVEDRLLALPELVAVRAIALYAPLRDEVQLDRLCARLSAGGCRVAYPRIDGPRLALHWVGEGDALCADRPGPLEPRASLPLAPAEALDAILVPGLMFDRRGRRLGRGGGHYDRLLAALPRSILTLGICLAEQLVEELPSEPHDVPVGWIATDREVLRIS